MNSSLLNNCSVISQYARTLAVTLLFAGTVPLQSAIAHERAAGLGNTRVAQAAPNTNPGDKPFKGSAKTPTGPFHLGTIRTKVREPRDERRNTKNDQTSPRATEISPAPDALLNDALSSLSAQRIKDARRKLELLVARFPDSQAADTARGQLGQLYAGIDTQPGATGAIGSQTPQPRTSIIKRVSPAPPLKSAHNTPAMEEFDDDATYVLPPINTTMSRRLGLSVGERVFFAAGVAGLDERALDALRAQARWLKRRKSYYILVTGHADEPGDDATNQTLSLARARAVRANLVKRGIEARRIRVLGLGRSQPVAKCKTPICAAQNRRVVTHILESPPVRVRAKSGTLTKTR